MNGLATDSAGSAVRKPRRWWKWLATGVLVLAVGLWSARHWLGERAAETMRGQLAARGIHVSWDSAAFVPGFGIAFKAFKLHRDAGRTQSLMAWDEVTLRRGLAGWTSLHLHAKGSELVVGDGDKRLRVEALAMDLYADRDRVHVKQWIGLVNGIRVDVAGEVSIAKIEALGQEAVEKRTPPELPATKGMEGVDLSFLGVVGEWFQARALGAEPVQVSVRIHEREGAPGYRLRAELDGVNLEWRGQRFPALGITMDWLLTGKPEPILVSRLTTVPEARDQKMEMIVDWPRQQVTLKAESVLLHFKPALLAAVPSLAGALQGLSVDQALRWQVEGVIPWGAKTQAELAGRVSANGALGLALGEGRRLQIERLQTAFELKEGTLTLRDVAGGLWGGQMAIAGAEMKLGQTRWTVQGARVQGIQIPLMRRDLGMQEGQVGQLEASWQGGGGLGLASLQGQGTLRVTDAVFFRLPLLGPLHLIFDRLVPGFAKDTVSRLETNHALRGGVLRLSDLKLQSTVTEIQAEGDLNLVTQRAKLTARAQLRGIAGLPTVLLGQLLTLDGEGPFSDIQWRLRYAPGLETVTGVAGAVGDTVLSVGGAGVDAASGAVKGAGKAAKGILSLPGRLFKKGEDKSR